MPKKIRVGEKALAHLSRGLYRSPASALRELVSNAWDANATVVRIDTNYPNFFQLSVEDNGVGFSKQDFEALMDGGIGNSKKRPTAKPLLNDRPVIGRLGIGMLGIAQICGSFKISSKTPNNEGFCAEVNLYDLLKEKLDQDDASIVSRREVDVGTYDFIDNFDPETINCGTFISTTDVHPVFVRSFQESLKLKKFKEPSLKWREVLTTLSKTESLQELGDYWRLLWELSAASPLRYLDQDALPDGLVAQEQERLKSYDFKVILDGIELLKPVYLHGNANGYTTFKIEHQEKKVYGKELAFHGYIAVQEGSQLRPDELRGIMIRIKNIGIGYYDQSMLDYRINEGPRSRWVTGEIFVTKGLEDALNIDRDSFNRFHPDFRVLQSYIHDVLQKNVFPRVYKEIEKRSTARQQLRSKSRSDHLKEVVSNAIKDNIVLSISRKDEPSTVSVNKSDGVVSIGVPDSESMRTKKVHSQLASSILAIFEVAIQKRTVNEQRKVFSEMLIKLLAKW